MKTILITGVAGFIGSHTAKKLLNKGDFVVGIDNFNEYYDPKIKKDRLKYIIEENKNFKFIEMDFTKFDELKKLAEKYKFDVIFHPGAQAGVRYSIENPFTYQETNALGTLNIFELARQFKIPKVVYASSSSVYGLNKKVPFSINDKVDTPISLYAATKKYNELMAHVYHHLYGTKMIGLRFFTVYGPWGRPDMAYYKFTKAILAGDPIDVYNNGNMRRDFTFIADIVDGVIASIDGDFEYEIFNLGNSDTVTLKYFIECIEKELGRKAKKNMLGMQPGDVKETFADIKESKEKLGFEPKTKIEDGIREFVKWYKEYYKKD